MGIISWLFGKPGTTLTEKNRSEECVTVKRVASSNDRYFELLSALQEWQRKHEYKKMLDCCNRTLDIMPAFVESTKKEFGAFDISSIPAIEVGGRYWAALNNKSALERVKSVVNSIRELRDGWGEFVDEAFEDEILSNRIQAHLRSNPGYLQNRLGKALNVPGRDTARIVRTLDNLGKIRRVKSGKTFELYLVEV